MEKKVLIETINNILLDKGYKKKNSYWKLKSNKIEKFVYLQKSNYSNRFYVYYGFNFEDLVLENITNHIFIGLGSLDDNENQEIQNTFDLEQEMIERFYNIEKYVSKIEEILAIVNDKNDVINLIESKVINPQFLPYEVLNYLNNNE